MLVGLSIRDIVLIKKLELEFGPGLWALTGETGAGKSILLDALGLALGARADRGLVRQGQAQAVAAAEFDIEDNHPVWTLLEEHGLGAGPQLILRRIQASDGRSRAFINDQPVGVATLKEVGELLVEVHGQQDDRLLLNTALHRELLDVFGAVEVLAKKTALAFGQLTTARATLQEETDRLSSMQSDVSYLNHAIEEIDRLSPSVDEEKTLADERRVMMNSEKISGALGDALSSLADDGGSSGRLSAAIKQLERETNTAQDQMAPIVSALDRALVETQDATDVVQKALVQFRFDQNRLDVLEERLFALRALARKHDVSVAELGSIRDRLASQLDDAENAQDRLEALQADVGKCRDVFTSLATKLSAKRQSAAGQLDKAVAKELKPLKLDSGIFRTKFESLPEEKAGPSGRDRISFEVSTNPGAPMGPLTQIASGGELSRFVLALKVAIARKGEATTLIFDEVDRGVGGAVADAVGERLQRIAQDGQVLVVTHSPQVAARASNHFRINKKSGAKSKAVTNVTLLDRKARQEEIARMLSAATITGEARAAAKSLLSTSEQTKKTGTAG